MAYFAATVALVVLGLATGLYLAGTHGTVPLEWIPSFGISLAFHVGGLASSIAFLANGIGVLILTYSGGYMHSKSGQAKYYATLLAFMGSVLGIALVSDLAALLTFWELTNLLSFILISYYTGEKVSQYAAQKSMLIIVPGGLFMLVGFLPLVWAPGRTGAIEGTTYSIPVLVEHVDMIRRVLTASGLFVPVLVLAGLGAAAKSAQAPFHV